MVDGNKLYTRVEEHHLPPGWAAVIREAVEAVGPTTPYPTDRWVQIVGWALDACLPDDGRAFFDRLVRSRANVTVIRGLGELDDLSISTPSDGRDVATLTATWLLAVAAKLGQPYSHSVEQSGRRIHTLVSLAGRERELTGRGGARLGMHNDVAALPRKMGGYPKYLVLGAVRPGDPPMPTSVVAAETALRQLPSRLQRVAMEPRRIEIRRPYAYPQPEESEVWRELPMLSRNEEGELESRVALYGDRTRGLDPEAEEAKRQFDAAAWRESTPVILQAGDLAVVNNRTTLHGRGEIPVSHRGADRWLLRVSVTEADVLTQLGDHMVNGVIDTRALLDEAKTKT